MRRLLLSALVLSALPALAQDPPEVEREVIIEIDTVEVDGPLGVEVERDEDGHVIIRRYRDGAVDENVFRLRLPESDEMAEQLRALGNGPHVWFDGDGPGRALRFFNQDGVSPETRERMRTLQQEAAALARQARTADGTERDDLVDRLDAVLGQLFEVRGQARQEEADRLRERARELMEEADEKEAALREREARRRALIEARRAELLGETTSDW